MTSSNQPQSHKEGETSLPQGNLDHGLNRREFARLLQMNQDLLHLHDLQGQKIDLLNQRLDNHLRMIEKLTKTIEAIGGLLGQ